MLKRLTASEDALGKAPAARATVSVPEAIAAARKVLIGVTAMSVVINLLYLTGSFFMLEVYDRVLPSRSLPTLVAIGLLAAGLYICQGVLDFIRSRIFVRLGAYLDKALSPKVFQSIELLSLHQRRIDPMQPGRDIDQIRSFLANGGPGAFLDLPWLPLYLGLCFAFHAWIGIAAIVGAIILITLTRLTERGTAASSRAAAALAGSRQVMAEAAHRNAEVLRALGMGQRLGQRWMKINDAYIAESNRTSDVSLGFGAISKVTRMAIQSAVLALGAYLVIRGEATGGIMIASSILVARALAPIELVIGHWKGFVAARQAWARLSQVLAALPERKPMELPAPSRNLRVSNLSVIAPGTDRTLVSNVSFELTAGSALGIVGNSASGKSSLVRAVVGVWPAARGHVRLDGAALDNWTPERLGRHIGYLPQNVELFSGTVAENIARFATDFEAEDVIAAATAAGIHDLILALPQGYDSQIGEQGSMLSAGQRQRVALARALYGNPFLIVLDEPNSNLDAEGDAALASAVAGARQRGSVVIIVTHRSSAIQACNMLMMMSGGNCVMVDTTEKVLAAYARPQQSAQPPSQTSLPNVNSKPSISSAPPQSAPEG
ncbi:MAG: type I secretion system permease/ATPase [Chelatococcus sp.]|nr:MAG: type I secretion system permease/ATPase [Chelatococcus sp.]